MFKAQFNKSGNIKLGVSMWSFSTLATDNDWFIPEYNMMVMGTCKGRCNGCRNACYVLKSYYRWTSKKTGRCSVKKSHARNTVAIRINPAQALNDLHMQIVRARNKPAIIRINQSGEIESAEYLAVFTELAKMHPEISFYLYTKAYDIVGNALDNGEIPQNMTVLFSIWHEYGIAEYFQYAHYENVKAFVYCDGFDYSAYGLEVRCMCAAYDIKGKMNHDITCEKCKLCVNSPVKVIGCYDH